MEGFLFGKTLPEHGMSGPDNAALCYRILQCLASKGKTVPTKVLSFVLWMHFYTNTLQVSERLWPYAIVPRNHLCYDTKVDKYFEKWRTVKSDFPSLLCVAHNDLTLFYIQSIIECSWVQHTIARDSKSLSEWFSLLVFCPLVRGVEVQVLNWLRWKCWTRAAHLGCVLWSVWIEQWREARSDYLRHTEFRLQTKNSFDWEICTRKIRAVLGAKVTHLWDFSCVMLKNYNFDYFHGWVFSCDWARTLELQLTL